MISRHRRVWKRKSELILKHLRKQKTQNPRTQQKFSIGYLRKFLYVIFMRSRSKAISLLRPQSLQEINQINWKLFLVGILFSIDFWKFLKGGDYKAPDDEPYSVFGTLFRHIPSDWPCSGQWKSCRLVALIAELWLTEIRMWWAL